MSIAQGGAGFPFLANEVYHYFSTGKCDTSDMVTSDIPCALKLVIQKVCYKFLCNLLLWYYS